MRKAIVNLHYKYLGPQNVVPYIHIEYVNDQNQSRDALETLYERRVNSVIPNTGYYYGKDLEGNEFKVDNMEQVPENVEYPFFQKHSEYGLVEDYQKNSIETYIKESILDVMKSFGDGLEVAYCVEREPGSFISNSTSDLSVFNDGKMKNALIHGVSLRFETQKMTTLSENNKVELIAMVMVRLFESMRKRNIGFSSEADSKELSVNFNIDGLSLDLIKDLPNFAGVISTVASNHVEQFNQKIEMESMFNNQNQKQPEKTETNKFVL